MKSRILTACAVAALMAGTGANAQELPGWQPKTICIEDATPQYCGFLEGQARNQISQQWEFIPSLVRERCLRRSEDEGTQSWRLFGDCIADSARAPSGEASAQASGDGEVSEIDTLRAELETAKSRISELEAAGDGGSGDGADTEARIAELEAELEKAQTAGRSSEVRIDGLQQRLMAAMAAVPVAAAATATAAAASDSGDADDAAALQAALDKAESRARGSEFRTNALQSTLKEIIASSKATKAEDDAALDKASTELKRSNARIEGLQARLQEVRAAADSASSSSDDGAERIAELEKSLEEAETDNKRSAARIAGLQERLLAANEAAASVSDDTGSDERIATLEADLAKANAGVRSGEARIEGLQQRLIEANERADAAPSGGGGDEAAGLRQQLDTAQSRIDNLQTRLRSSRDALSGAREGESGAQRNLDNARLRILALQDAMITSRKASQDEMSSLKAELARAQENAGEGADTMEADKRFQNLLANQRERSARVAATVAAQRMKISELETEVDSLRSMAETVGVASCQQRMNDAVGSDGIQFANNKADIRADAAQVIDRLITIARDCPATRITVKGHTDSMGERDYNLGLSQRRADAVVAYMQRNGIAPGRVNSVGVGPDEPIADNNTRAGRAQNRRIELLVE